MLIISGAIIAPVLWHFVGMHRKKRALQWWFQQQSLQLWYESERIRNDIFQEMFVIRRYFESSFLNNDSAPNDLQDCLDRFERLQKSLDTLNHQLCPAYIEESLPLAIQSLLNEWQLSLPILQIETELPTEWNLNSFERSYTVLTTLDELLKIVLSTSLANPCLLVNLQADYHWANLVVRVHDTDTLKLFSILKVRELTYVYQSFRWLTSGRCFFQKDGSDLVWCFRWRFDVSGKL
ncbi:MAG: hypothetical protein KME11_22525 [Timaviella obliquedivisa GSE-PSE-MK23-08B]|nr:hypothetical protein [Timaviella obliquedivisa GSE-PSE-MK23-08B]